MVESAVSGQSEPDQLVVDLQHLGVVTKLLGQLGVKHDEVTEDDCDHSLGLALVTGLATDQGPFDIGNLLAVLRQRSAAERDGWTPTIGRNRFAGAVIGEGTVESASHKPMAGADPQPFDPQLTAEPMAGPAEAGAGVRVVTVDTRSAEGPEPLPFRSGHGTFVRSVIQRQAPKAEVTIEPVLNAQNGLADSWNVARTIVRLADSASPPHILNLSLGCYTLAGGPPLVIARAIERVADRLVIVAAAGNNGNLPFLVRGRDAKSISWPAGLPPVISVGATDADGARAPWSPGGSWVSCTALGVNVVGDYLTGKVQLSDSEETFSGRAVWSGTSFAAAIVSGAIAAATTDGDVHRAARRLVSSAASGCPRIAGA